MSISPNLSYLHNAARHRVGPYRFWAFLISAGGGYPESSVRFVRYSSDYNGKHTIPKIERTRLMDK